MRPFHSLTVSDERTLRPERSHILQKSPGRYIINHQSVSAFALASLAAYGIITAVGLWRVLPFTDQWEAAMRYDAWSNGRLSLLDLLWWQNNEHRHVSTFLAFLADFSWLQGQAILPFTALAVATVALATLLGLLIAKDRPTLARIIAALTALAALVAPLSLENLTLPFNLCWPLSGLLAVVAFYSIARLAEAPEHAALHLVIAIGATFLGVLTSAQGALAAVIVIIMATLLPIGMRRAVTLAIFALIAIAIYFVGWHSPSNQTPMHAPFSPSGFLLAARLALAITGMPAYFFGPQTMVILGALGVALWGILILRHKTADAATLALLALAALALGTFALIGYGRASAIIYQEAAQSRYATFSVLFWISLIGATWRLKLPAMPAVGGMLLLSTYLSGLVFIELGRHRASIIDSTTQYLREGGRAADVLNYVAPTSNRLLSAILFMQQQQLSVFAGQVRP